MFRFGSSESAYGASAHTFENSHLELSQVVHSDEEDGIEREEGEEEDMTGGVAVLYNDELSTRSKAAPMD